MIKFYIPDTADERMKYAVSELQNKGYSAVNKIENADYILVAPGNRAYRNSPRVIKYYDEEDFLLKNAFLTAEIAVGLAITQCENSLSDSNILILGYGRIAKALLRYLSSFTHNITICARNENARAQAECMGAFTTDFEHMDDINKYDYVFNTVPFPVFADNELSELKQTCVLIELASLPGGIDRHFAEAAGLKLIQAGKLPARFAPKRAGTYVAQAVDKLIKEGRA